MRNYTLDDFGGGRSDVPLLGPAPDGAAQSQAPDEDRLAAYEAGYQSGWDDCASAEAEAHRNVGADLAANIAEIAITYDRARGDVLSGLGPLFEEIAGQFLPALATEAIAPAVIAELEEAARVASDGRVKLVASPNTLPTLEKLVEERDDLDVSLQAEPAYADGQVSIQFGQEHRKIDLTDAANRMAEAIRAFVQTATGTPAPLDQGDP
ncbi:MAG: hypothetical protein AAF376_10340 [Pseudomonadota bacterium]